MMKRELLEMVSFPETPQANKKFRLSTSNPVSSATSIEDVSQSIHHLPKMEEQRLCLSSGFQKMKNYASLSPELNTDPCIFLSDYSMIPNDRFREKLSQSIQTAEISNENQSSLITLLDNDEILIFLRGLTQLKHQSNYFKLKYEQWSHYHHLCVTERICTGRVSKKFALDHSMSSSYGRNKILIKQRMKKYQLNLGKINQEIEQHLKTCPSLLTDPYRYIRTIDQLIHSDQYIFRMELERQRILLKLDARDHQLVQKFYQLNPRKTEVSKNDG